MYCAELKMEIESRETADNELTSALEKYKTIIES